MIINKDKKTLDMIYADVIRYWLMGMLLFIPFVNKVSQIISPWNSKLASSINRLDEMTIVILLPLAVREFFIMYKKKDTSIQLYLILIVPIVILSILGFISGKLNGNSLFITALGIFAYIKFFLFVFIYAVFFKNFNFFIKLFRIMVFVAVIVGAVAVIQEVWIIYISFLADITGSYKETYAFISQLLDVNNVTIAGSGSRLGIYRTSSLLSHYNLLGLYSLFILTIYLHMVRKINFTIMFFLVSGIVASVSRAVYAGFAILSGLQMFKGRKWFILIIIPLVAVLIVMFFKMSAGDFNISKTISEKYSKENTTSQFVNNISYRKFARQKAMEVWKDYPFWGVGPGKFGGAVAYTHRTHFYEEYDFLYIMNWFHSLEQLWPQALAEMGIVGTGALSILFLSLFVLLRTAKQKATSYELKGLFAGLFTFTFILLIYTMSGTLNLVSILLPYCAFVGIGLGSLRQSYV